MKKNDYMIFVVAEIGVNWDGNFEVVNEMMRAAKSSGCNAVKFQAYEEKMLGDHPLKTRLMKSAISNNNIGEIDNLSRSIGIEWFCTPMYPDAVEMLNPYVKRFKIRVSDGRPILENKSTELFERILKTNKEVIISSERSPIGTNFYEHPNVKWLYCVPKYPCNINDLDFTNISEFDGYSNHCPNIIAPITAATLGAEIIEVHITHNKSEDFIDNNVSFDYNELENMVKLIRFSEKIKK